MQTQESRSNITKDILTNQQKAIIETGQLISQQDIEKLPGNQHQKSTLQERLKTLYLKEAKLPDFLSSETKDKRIEDSYINLAIIDLEIQQKKEADLKASSENTELDSPEDNVDEENTIEINTLFKNKTTERVLIHGKAGIGKTTLVRYITYQWASNKLWQEFDYIFLLPLRTLNTYTKSEDGLKRLIHERCFDGLAKKVEREIELEQIHDILTNNKVLLLLDGYDELNRTDITNKILNTALDHPNLNIVMTSRPNIVEVEYRDKFSKQLVNIGLTNTDIIGYINKNFKGKEEYKKSLLKFVKENKTIQGICHTPINLHLLCLVWTRLLETSADEINNNELITTKLYLEITDWLIKRYVTKTGKDKAYAKNLDHAQIEKDFESTLKLMEQIAFEGLKQGKAVLGKGMLSKHGVDASSYKIIQEIGLLKALDGDDYEGNIGNEHYFIHLTFQEYMAARSIVRTLNSRNEQQVIVALEFLNDNKYNQRYERMLCFIAGINSLDAAEEPSQALLHFWNILMNGKVDLGVIKQFQLVLKCIDESGIDPCIPDIGKIENYLKETLGSLKAVRASRVKISQRLEKWLGIEKSAEEINEEESVNACLRQLRNDDIAEKIEGIEAASKLKIENTKQQGRIIQALIKMFEIDNYQVYTSLKQALNELIIHTADGKLQEGITDLLIHKETEEDEIKIEFENNIRNNNLVVDKNNGEIINSVKLKTLPALLGDKDSVVINAAIKILGKLSKINPVLQSKAVDLLVPLLSDGDTCVNVADGFDELNITDLAVQSKVVDLLVPLLKHERRVPGFLGFFFKNTESGLSTSSAVEAFGKLNITDLALQSKVTGLLAPLLNNKDSDVRHNAVEAFNGLNIMDFTLQSQVVDLLAPLFEDKDIRRDVLKAFGKFNITNFALQDRVIGLLAPLLENEDMRRDVLEVLNGLNITDFTLQNKVVNLLAPLFKDKCIRRSAATTLSELCITDPTLRSKVASLLICIPKDENESKRGKTVTRKRKTVKIIGQELNTIDSSKVIDLLMLQLKDEDRNVRDNAVEAFGRLNITDPVLQNQVFDLLIPPLKDKDVARSAVKIFDKLNIDFTAQNKVIDLLIQLFENEDRYVADKAAVALGNLKVTDSALQSKVIDLLVPLLRNGDSSVGVGMRVLSVFDHMSITDSTVQVKVIDLMTPLLKDEKHHACCFAIHILGELKIIDLALQNQIVDLLALLIENKYVYEDVTSALSALNITDLTLQSKVINLLVPLLGNGVYIAEALGKLNIIDSILQSKVLDLLIPLLKDKNYFKQGRWSQPYRVWVFDKFDTAKPALHSRVIDLLISLLEDEDINTSVNTKETLSTCEHVIWVLAKFNIVDCAVQSRVANLLAYVLKGGRNDVRKEAEKALKELTKHNAIKNTQNSSADISELPSINNGLAQTTILPTETCSIPIIIETEATLDNILTLLTSKEVVEIKKAFQLLDSISLINLEQDEHPKLYKIMLSFLNHKDDGINKLAIQYCNEIQSKNLQFAEELTLTLIEILNQNKSDLKFINALTKLQSSDTRLTSEIFNTLTQQFLSNDQQKEQLSPIVNQLLNSSLEKLIIQTIYITLTQNLLALFRLPLFKQAAVVLNKDSITINYRGYQRTMKFEGEDMPYKVFVYFHQHPQAGIETILLEKSLDFGKILEIPQLNIDHGALTVPNSILQEHSYSRVDKSVRLGNNRWLVSVVRKDRSVCKNARHAFLIVEGRNLFYEAELYKLELIQNNSVNFPDKGKVQIEAYPNVQVNDLARVFQIILGNDRYERDIANTFAVNKHFYHQSCLISFEVARKIINDAKAEQAKGADVSYDFYGIKAPNCFTWARKKLRDNLTSDEYEELKIESKGERYADPLGYLGPTTSTWSWVGHTVQDGAAAIGGYIPFYGK